MSHETDQQQAQTACDGRFPVAGYKPSLQPIKDLIRNTHVHSCLCYQEVLPANIGQKQLPLHVSYFRSLTRLCLTKKYSSAFFSLTTWSLFCQRCLRSSFTLSKGLHSDRQYLCALNNLHRGHSLKARSSQMVGRLCKHAIADHSSNCIVQFGYTRHHCSSDQLMSSSQAVLPSEAIKGPN